MADLQITCIKQMPHSDTHYVITHRDGAGWRRTQLEVIASIKARGNKFYALVGGKRADVDIDGNEHCEILQTHAVGLWSNNPLGLPGCG